MPYLFEEAHEVAEALLNNDVSNLREELGDLFLQILFHCQIAQESGHFDLAEIFHDLADKLVERHPHIFKEKTQLSAEQTELQWNALKAAKKPSHFKIKTSGLCQLIESQKIAKAATELGYGFRSRQDILTKLQEEIGEWQAATQQGNSQSIRLEFGDILWTIVTLAEFEGIQAFSALKQSTHKFVRRVEHIEQRLEQERKSFASLSEEYQLTLWEWAKQEPDEQLTPDISPK
jgi:MazG family protein